jgi:hypothetical protein
MGLYTLLLMGMTPPGATFTGLVADAYGIERAVLIEAGICLLGVVVMSHPLRKPVTADL